MNQETAPRVGEQAGQDVGVAETVEDELEQIPDMIAHMYTTPGANGRARCGLAEVNDPHAKSHGNYKYRPTDIRCLCGAPICETCLIVSRNLDK